MSFKGSVPVERITGRSIQRNSKGRFFHNGRGCECTTSLSHYCAVVDFLQLEWLKEGVLGCRAHQTLIVLQDLQHHIQKDHTSIRLVTRLKAAGLTFDDFIEHFISVFGMDRHQTLDDFLSKPISRSIDLLLQPEKALQCPWCLGWVKFSTDDTQKSNAYRMHLKNHSSCACRSASRPTTPLLGYTQRLRGYTGHKRLILEQSWSPPSATEPMESKSLSSPPPPPPLLFGALESEASFLNTPRYIQYIKYDAWLSNVKADPRHLLLLVEGPRDTKHMESQYHRNFEENLGALPDITRRYLAGALSFIQGCSGEARIALVLGSRCVTLIHNTLPS